jgi:hypothetical protein
MQCVFFVYVYPKESEHRRKAESQIKSTVRNYRRILPVTYFLSYLNQFSDVKWLHLFIKKCSPLFDVEWFSLFFLNLHAVFFRKSYQNIMICF